MTAAVRFELFPLDRQRSIDFYTNILGFELRQNKSDYAYLVRDGIRIGLGMGAASYKDRGAWGGPGVYATQTSGMQQQVGMRPEVKEEYRVPPTGVELVFEVDNLDVELAGIKASGWEIFEDMQERPWGLKDFRIRDRAGYYLRITNTYADGGDST